MSTEKHPDGRPLAKILPDNSRELKRKILEVQLLYSNQWQWSTKTCTTPPLASQSQADDELEGPESLTEDEVAAAFDEIEQRIAEYPSAIYPQLEGYEILAGKVIPPNGIHGRL
ncbi:hypothetical protein BDR07DRAFT_1376781 [Suillus spraguei]|nr:hypothetical protein BDR07DRAFT_1376781 [Suillus spraguei]